MRTPRLLLAAMSLMAAVHVGCAGIPTNGQLIAAMPESIESVLVLQAEPLSRRDCALSSELQPFLGTLEDAALGAERSS